MFTKEEVHSALTKYPPTSTFIQPLSLALFNMCKGVALREDLYEQVRLILEITKANELGIGYDKQA